jgi:tRNA(Ile)-lysidine synthase
LAQHADDQVETLLIALSRGAGLPGLASMPANWTRLDLNWHRPCLALPGAALREWLKEQGPVQGQSWVEDPSNTDERFTRNRIRAKVLPALAEALPAFRETFARSAAHAAQAQEVLNEVAAHDLEKIGVPPRIQALKQLSRARQALVLRHWLRQHHATTPSTAQLHELLDQVAACTTRGHRLHLKVGQGFVVRAGACLSYLA